MARDATPDGFGTTVDPPYHRAVERTGEALSKEGFRVLTETDVTAAL